MRPLKIAVADDEPAVRALLALWLTKLGHVVVAVDGGRELAELCRGGGFDVAVSDVDMPDGDGLVAAAVIRRECGIPVLLASGGWTPDLSLQARGVGAVCLDKPILPLVLAAHLNEVGRRRKPALVLASRERERPEDWSSTVCRVVAVPPVAHAPGSPRHTPAAHAPGSPRTWPPA